MGGVVKGLSIISMVFGLLLCDPGLILSLPPGMATVGTLGHFLCGLPYSGAYSHDGHV